MRDMGLVCGSAAQAQPVVIGVDTVYVHENIAPLEDGIFQYREKQYTKDEYITILAEKVMGLNT